MNVLAAMVVCVCAYRMVTWSSATPRVTRNEGKGREVDQSTLILYCRYERLTKKKSIEMQCNVCMYGEHFQPSMDQPGMVANPARG